MPSFCTQVFSDRDLEIESLRIREEETSLVHLTARFQCERSILVTYGEYSRIFPSSGGQTSIEFSYPVQKDGILQLAYAENEFTEDFVIMVRSILDENTQIPVLYNRLQGLTFPILDREVKTTREVISWLEGNFRWIGRADPGECTAYVGDQSFVCRKTAIHVPLFGTGGDLTLGCGSGRQKTIKHRLRIDLTGPDGFGRH